MAFERRLKLEFHGSQVTPDAGLLACRELDEALSLTAPAAELLHDWRTGDNPSSRRSRYDAIPSTAGWQGMRTPMTPNGSQWIRQCDKRCCPVESGAGH